MSEQSRFDVLLLSRLGAPVPGSYADRGITVSNRLGSGLITWFRMTPLRHIFTSCRAVSYFFAGFNTSVPHEVEYLA
jgi:hypothetical protein